MPGMQLFGYCISTTEMLRVPPTTRVIYLWTHDLFKNLVSCLIGPAALQCWDSWISFLAKVWHQMGRLMNNSLVMKQGADMKHGADRWGRQSKLPAYCRHFQSGQVRCLGLSSKLVIPHIPENTLSHSELPHLLSGFLSVKFLWCYTVHHKVRFYSMFLRAYGQQVH